MWANACRPKEGMDVKTEGLENMKRAGKIILVSLPRPERKGGDDRKDVGVKRERCDTLTASRRKVAVVLRTHQSPLHTHSLAACVFFALRLIRLVCFSFRP